MHNYIAQPRSIKDIRSLALQLRKNIGCDDPEFKEFPIVEFLELILPKIEKDFILCVLEKEEMGDIHGLAHPEENYIEVRQDVYNRAVKGFGRDRFTLAHELGHYLMHGKENVQLARIGDNKQIKAYQNPEWQADTFAAELLMPITLIDTSNPYEISEKFGVSLKAAEIRVKKIYKH